MMFKKSEVTALFLHYISFRALTDKANKRNIMLDETIARAATGASAGSSSRRAARAEAGEDEDEEFEEEDGGAAAAAAAAAEDAGSGASVVKVVTAHGAVPVLRFDCGTAKATTDTLAATDAELAESPSLPREDMVGTWQSCFHRHHTITYSISGAKEVVAASGSPPRITILVKRIQGGRRSTTHIENVSAYRLEDARLGRDLQRLLAASATVQPSARNPRVTEVMVQGDEAARVADFLVNSYGLPRSVVVIEGEGGGSGAKGGGRGGRGGGGARLMRLATPA